MRVSQFPLLTLKETPADAETVSHRLMLRAGLVRRLAAGLYTWLPLGLRVLRRVETVIREEMERAGALEVLMPMVQPAELWQESGRWEAYGPELLRLKDRHQRDFCLGPTHEEVITDLFRREIRSYRQLPLNLYQIQTKFRDEVRPRFGVMRAREFVMKDAYSFHLDPASLHQTYETMHQTYCRIFERLGLDFRAVEADTGSIGGQVSHEFHVLASSGEDAIAFSADGAYAANVELAAAAPPRDPRPAPGQAITEVATPDQRTIADVATFLEVPASHCLKTLVVAGAEADAVALVLRGDHTLNDIKAIRHPAVAEPLRLLDADQVRDRIGCDLGSIGPVGLSVPVVVDHAAAQMADFVCGANRADHHLVGVNWGRDLPEPETADLREVVEGDEGPDGHGRLSIARGIEVGHIFQLGQKYSVALGAHVLDESGREPTVTMGCYGIGVSRVVAAAIEQNHDESGICWPETMAPFDVALVGINAHRSETVANAVDGLYEELRGLGFEVLWDDRAARPGVIFADLDLVGIPWRVVVSERGLAAGTIELKDRRRGESRDIPRETLVETLRPG